MTDEIDNNGSTFEEDELNTTAPQSEPQGWKMPDPVFRRSSGKLPQGYVHETGEDVGVEDSAPPTASAAQPAPSEPLSAPQPKPKGSILKMLLVLLGLAAMIAFLVVFLTVVYFLFLR